MDKEVLKQFRRLCNDDDFIMRIINETCPPDCYEPDEFCDRNKCWKLFTKSNNYWQVSDNDIN